MEKEILAYKEDQWDKNHKRTDDKNYVTATGLDEILKYHKLDAPVNKEVLEIGVGRGDTARELAKTNKLYCSDISKVGLEEVSECCEDTFLSKNIKQAPPVDLAISHLTFQHCHEQEVIRILNDVNLKDGAWFSFQFAALDLQKTRLTDIILNDLNEAMLYFYSYDKMIGLVNQTNKKMSRAVGPFWFDAPFSFNWYIFQVKNR